MNSVYFNLSFDDVHPESSGDGTDCGGDRDGGVFRYFPRLLRKCPELKITLFVTPNWIDKANDSFFLRNMKRIFGMKYFNTWVGEPFLLTKHKDWCSWLNSFKNIEVAVHGYSHHADRKLHSQEFQDMGYNDCRARLVNAERVFKDAGLNYVKGFRPPGWGISDGLFEALKDLKYDFISLDSVACNVGDLSRYKVEDYRGLWNVPQNWDIARGTIDEALEILDKYGLLMAKGHISNYYDGERIGNGLNGVTFGRLCELFERMKDKKSCFVSMKEIARRMA